MRRNGFILKEGWFRLDILKKFFCSEDSETLEQVTQRSGRWHKPEIFKVRLDEALAT